MAGLLSPAIDPVVQELRRWACEPFDIVTDNCGISVMTYVGLATGCPVPLWLKAFGRLGVARLMDRDAAFIDAARRALAQMGCTETDAPRHGDVGLVDLTNGLTAAICLGDLWAARGVTEAVIGPATHRIAWRVSCPTL